VPLVYRGGRLPLNPELHAAAADLAGRAVEAVPGLRGYVGVDLLLLNHPPGRIGLVIEINPRLTTSYVGLRRLARFNVMRAMLAVLEGKPPGPLEYAPGPIAFRPDGTVA
jgi:predicted ATP-grasp superfamily ATP-dependent carboligase